MIVFFRFEHPSHLLFIFQVQELISKYEKVEAEAEAAKKEKEKAKE